MPFPMPGRAKRHPHSITPQRSSHHRPPTSTSNRSVGATQAAAPAARPTRHRPLSEKIDHKNQPIQIQAKSHSAALPSVAADSVHMQRLKPATRFRYGGAVAAFVSWAQRRGLRVGTDARAVDGVLLQYLRHLWRSDSPQYRAKLALAGIMALRPALRRHLPESSAFLTGWKATAPSTQYPPMTRQLTAAVAADLARRGQFRVAVAALVAFDALLRVGELTKLRACDIVNTTDIDRSYRPSLVLHLPKTKTGMNQSVTLLDPAIAALLLHLVRQTVRAERLIAKAARFMRGPTTAAQRESVQRQLRSIAGIPGWTDPIFGVDDAEFRRAFKAATARLGLSARYVPHSLRHGGATHLHCLGVDVSSIVVRGRWRSLDSARRYLQAGQSLVGLLRPPKGVNDEGWRVLCDLPASLLQFAGERVPSFQPPAVASAGTLNSSSVAATKSAAPHQ